jgi:AAA15 family ATPase/GTPase
VLYGANAAGKSNFVQALDILRRLVRYGIPHGNHAPFLPFRLDHKTQEKPTSFELQFLEGNMVFRYGVCYDTDRIHEELLSVYQNEKERNLFYRTTKEDGTVDVKLGVAAKGKNSSPKIKALAKIGARKNQLFLAEIVNLDNPDARGLHLQLAIQWFTCTLSVIPADAPFERLARTIDEDKEFAQFAVEFLRDADTGIADLNVNINEIQISKISEKLPQPLLQMLVNLQQNQSLTLPGPSGGEMSVAGAKKDTIEVREITTLHGLSSGKKVQFPIAAESDGTQRLLNLLPALYYLLGEGGVFVIDELERSMHPILAKKFIEFFKKVGHKTKSQLIFTTHESTLLDLDLMRRDGIWFVEKDKEGATHLHSLADFKVRSDLNIEKGYLTGRFGAIPFLGGIDRLMEKKIAMEVGA